MTNGNADPDHDPIWGFAGNLIVGQFRWQQSFRKRSESHRAEMKIPKQRFSKPTAVVRQFRGFI